MADGGCMVSEYMNMDEVVAILSVQADQRPLESDAVLRRRVISTYKASQILES